MSAPFDAPTSAVSRIWNAVITLLLLAAPADSPAQRGPDAGTPSTTLAAPDSVFAFVRDASPGCAVGISAPGMPVLRRAYGLANLEHGIPITTETVFESGSIAKQFTAAAVLLLARDGRLSLDALLHEGRFADAVSIFELDAREYPEAWNPHDSLGDAYAAARHRRRATKLPQVSRVEPRQCECEGNDRDARQALVLGGMRIVRSASAAVRARSSLRARRDAARPPSSRPCMARPRRHVNGKQLHWPSPTTMRPSP